MARVVLVIEDSDHGQVEARAHFERGQEDVEKEPTPAEYAAANLMCSDVADALLHYKHFDMGLPESISRATEYLYGMAEREIEGRSLDENH